MNVTVLGAGLVGLPIALELAKDKDLKVTIVDVDKKQLEKAANKGISTKKADLCYPGEVRSSADSSDLVINAVPGHIGYNALKWIIESGKDVVDIAFFPEDPFTLEELALKNKTVVVFDAGVAPGMSNVLSAHGYSEMDEIEEIRIYVGGLPKERTLPYEYKAGFSPIDVIEEYTRPARFVSNGKVVTRPALSDPEFIEFNKVGTLEAFNSDGLRSLMKTLKVPEMIEKTLRYPGHREKMLMLRESGFFSNEETEINGQMVRPIDLTTKLLFPYWKLEEGESDLTVMRIIIKGTKGREKLEITWNLYDEFDSGSGIHSMARTTGYTATGIARLILNGKYNVPGIHPPEHLAKDPELVEFLLGYLKERGIVYEKRMEKG